MQLAPFVQPEIPGAVLLLGEDTDGWRTIDRLSALDCLLCQFDTLAEVPFQHEGGWKKAWSTALLRWEQAGSEEEETRALKWLLFLPQVQLRPLPAEVTNGHAVENLSENMKLPSAPPILKHCVGVGGWVVSYPTR